MKNFNIISTNDLSLKCEICSVSELDLITFGSINGRHICLNCIKKYDLKDIDSILNNERSKIIEKVRKEIYNKIDEEYFTPENDDSFGAEDLGKIMEYINIILEIKYKLSEIMAINEVLSNEIIELNNANNCNSEILNFKKNYQTELSEKILRGKSLLQKVLSLGVYQGINHYRFFKI
jgi:hypothetical protein